MSREKYSAQIKIDACERYLSGRSSGRELCQEYGFDSSVLREWAAKYRMHGAEAFWEQNGNKSYTREFKKMVVEEYLTSHISLLQLTAKYNISSTYTVRSWIKKYNSNMELKDYEPKPEVKHTKKAVETVVAMGEDLPTGKLVYTFYGSFEFNKKYKNYSFEVNGFQVCVDDVSNLIDFLASPAIKGCGKVTAKKIVKAFGDKTLDVLKIIAFNSSSL